MQKVCTLFISACVDRSTKRTLEIFLKRCVDFADAEYSQSALLENVDSHITERNIIDLQSALLLPEVLFYQFLNLCCMLWLFVDLVSNKSIEYF